jgi:hypothetical protein
MLQAHLATLKRFVAQLVTRMKRRVECITNRRAHNGLGESTEWWQIILSHIECSGCYRMLVSTPPCICN